MILAAAVPRLTIASIALLLVTLGAFSGAFHSGFVNFDDPDYTFGNPHVRSGLSAENIEWAFSHSYVANWIPLTWISLMADYQFLGDSSSVHHAVNLLFHALNVVLLCLLLYAMTGAYWRSIAVAALFAVHPLRVESVVWIAERKDVLSTFFALLALGAYLVFTRRRSTGTYLVTLALFCCGLLAKPMLVTLPAGMILLDSWPLKRGWRIREKLPFLAIAIAAASVAFIVQQKDGAVAGLATVPLSIRLANIPIAYTAYLGKFVWPTNLAVYYPYEQCSAVWPALLSTTLVLSISVFAWKRRRDLPYVATGWAWYVITLVPVIGLIQVGGQAYADRYTYLPMIGIALLVVWGIAEVALRSRLPARALSAAAICLAGVLVALTYRQVTYWHDSISLFRHAVEVTGDNYFAYNNLGTAFEDAGDLRNAISSYEAAIRIMPVFSLAQYNLGTALLRDPERTPDAIDHLRRAIDLRPNDAKAHNNLGKALAINPRTLPEAVSEYRAAIAIDPGFAEAQNNLGNALVKLPGNVDSAVSALNASIAAQPESAEAHYNLALALSDRPNGLTEAIAEDRKAIHIRPDYPEAHNNLGALLARSGDLRAAKSEFETAIRQRPAYKDAHFNLGITEAQLGSLGNAIKEWRVVEAADPNHVQAHYNLGIALAKESHFNEAIEELQIVMRLRPDPQIQNAIDELKRQR